MGSANTLFSGKRVNLPYPDEWMKQVEKGTGDELISRGIKLPLRSHLRRIWFGWNAVQDKATRKDPSKK